MDEINDFFDLTKDFVRETIPSVKPTPSVISKSDQPIKHEYKAQTYPYEALQEQERLMMEFDVNKSAAHSPSHLGWSKVSGAGNSCMDEMDDLSDDEGEIAKSKMAPIDDSVYRNYCFDVRHDNTMPIHAKKDEILSLIRKKPVVILEGDTGCGKTTQVPQYILADAFQRNEYCKIVCTQPRRIAAISIAKRVSGERGWEPGTVVGYKIGLHSNVSKDTHITYCTTGVLLQSLLKARTLQAYTHILLDEVHERDLDMDFLLIVIRMLLVTNSCRVKIILMSATINTAEFANYFKIRNLPAPVLHVSTHRNFRVDKFYFESIGPINTTDFKIDYSEPGIAPEMYKLAVKLLVVIVNIEKQEAAASANQEKSPASILIFLPGLNEIDELFQKILNLEDNETLAVKLFPIRLHSKIPPDEQSTIFAPVLTGYRKVILATNIAESSITVPDVKYVIDFCLTKYQVTDTATNFTSLEMHWASRANCRQRAGRVGRLMNGRVYRLVNKGFYESNMEEFGKPEMMRCPLEGVVLKAKLLDMGSPCKVLALAMTQPDLHDVHNTLLTLKEIGALYRTTNGEYHEDDGDLTFMGRVMVGLPIDLRLTRLIIMGYMFSCLEDAIIMAAGLSVRSIFSMGTDPKRAAVCQMQKLTFADGSASDMFSILRAYRIWVSMCEMHHSRSNDQGSAWANRLSINVRCINEMHLLVLELKGRLGEYGICESTSDQRIQWMERERTLILKIVIAGAFYPNYFTRTNMNDYDQERSAYNQLCGHDPCDTVYFSGFDERYIGQLYTRSIKELFRNVRISARNIDVHFLAGSQRVFVTFKSDPAEDDDTGKCVVPGQVRTELYKAIHMRMLRLPTKIHVMEPDLAIKHALKTGIGQMVEGEFKLLRSLRNSSSVVLPNVFKRSLCGYITHVDHCSRFYFQPLSETEAMREIHELLNAPQTIANERYKAPSDIAKGTLLAAPFDGKYCRARVIKVIPSSRQHVQFKVLFIDYGNAVIVDFHQLRRFHPHAQHLINMPPRMFECRLAMTLPSLVKCPHGRWSKEANRLLQNLAVSGQVEIEVFSLVGALVNVIIRQRNGTLNELLVEKGYARSSDENFMSKTDHDYRLRKQSIERRIDQKEYLRQNEEYLRSQQMEVDDDVEPPPANLCMHTMYLKGPFSPLETNIYTVIKAGASKSVHVDRDSVNCVLLDTDPHDMHERLLVAANVTESPQGNNLMARYTTLMPNIHGFGALMTLIFCPTVQIKANPSQTKYATILAGLGYNEETLAPLYEDHDIVLNLDTNILQDDVELINHLRYCMDNILYTANADEELPQLTAVERVNMMAKIKSLLIRLLSKDRKYIETHVDHNDGIWENNLPRVTQPMGDRSIFPFHSVPTLYDEKFDHIHTLTIHCQELHKMRHHNHPIEPIMCLLCNQTLESVSSLRIHLLSQLHRDREHAIRFKPV